MTLGKKAEILAISIVFIVWIGIAVLYLKLLPKHGEVVYNCSIAEISPDFPPQVREECRKLRMDKIK